MSIPKIALIEAGYSKEDAAKIIGVVEKHSITKDDLNSVITKMQKLEDELNSVRAEKYRLQKEFDEELSRKRQKPSMSTWIFGFMFGTYVVTVIAGTLANLPG